MKDKCKIKNLPISSKKRANDPSEKPVFNARKSPFAWRGCVKTWIFHSKHHGKTFHPPLGEVCQVIHHHYGMLHHVNCLCLPQFSFFLNLSVTCWLAVGRLLVTCRSTDGRQLTDSWPTGFLGSSSLQLPEFLHRRYPSSCLVTIAS